ncbi:MAG TPA: hypothetical protein VFH95_03610 [Candidatus Kapabacteria bacterium]|nr:hypothetical protein [Candidatus Kapabacteria bacterium]
MSTLEVITGKAKQLPRDLQEEVADFTDYLLHKFERNSSLERQWSSASMSNAIRGFEDDPVTYSKSDVKANGI